MTSHNSHNLYAALEKIAVLQLLSLWMKPECNYVTIFSLISDLLFHAFFILPTLLFPPKWEPGIRNKRRTT